LITGGRPGDLRRVAAGEATELTDVFGYVSPNLIARSPRFGLGEGLFAGGFIASPMIVRMGARLTREGGTDVKVPLR
jgi:hypothetical protein